MKKEKLLNAIGEIDDDLISDALHDTKKKKLWLRVGSLAAVLALCVCAGFFGAGLWNSGVPGALPSEPAEQGTLPSESDVSGLQTAANSIVILDVNPSIALTVSEEERIVSAEGLNEDGRIILSEMDLTDVDLTVAVNAIIGSMLQKGYLSDLQNAILVSVENADAEKSSALQERICAMIGNTLQNSNLEGSVLSQTLSDTEALEQMALEYGISLGKAALIQEVIALDPALTVENLAPLSITEIALISQSRSLTPVALTQDGSASDKAYISRDAAIGAAYAYVNVSAADVTALKAEFDSDHGIMVYEVEFYVGTTEYECDVDARTGQVVKCEIDGKDAAGQGGANAQQPSDPGQTPAQNPSGTWQTSDQYIGEEAAKEAALARAGIAVGAVSYINAWLEYDDGRPEHYEVEFAADGVRYKYEIDLYSGAVLEQETEYYNDYNGHHSDGHHSEEHHYDGHHYGGGSQSGSAGSGTDIGIEAAKAAALSHAGLTASQVTGLKAEYDYDDGIAVYDVEFRYGGYEYEYEIDAATGNILEYDIDD